MIQILPCQYSTNNILKIINNVANKTIKIIISGMLSWQNLDH